MGEERTEYLATAMGQVDLGLVLISAVWAVALFRFGARGSLVTILLMAVITLVGTEAFVLLKRPEDVSALVLFWALIEMPIFFSLLVASAGLLVLSLFMAARRILAMGVMRRAPEPR